MKLWKKLILFIVVLIISFSLTGCYISDADILAKAAQATWQMSGDGYTYLGYIRYVDNYWYFSMNTITSSFLFGSWTETQFWKNTTNIAPTWEIVKWSAVPEVVKFILVEVVRESMPLVSVWSNFFIIFPVCFDENCTPALMPTEQPM